MTKRKKENKKKRMDEGEQNVGGYGETVHSRDFTSFDWFDEKVYQSEIADMERKYIKPQSKDPYHFLIPANKDYWTKLSSTKIHGKLKVVKVDNAGAESIPSTLTWSLVNHIYHAIWSSVIVKVNGNEFEDTAALHYHRKVPLQIELNTSPSYRKNVLYHNNAYVPDDFGKADVMDELTPYKAVDTNAPMAAFLKFEANDKYNSGFDRRRAGLQGGASVAFSTNIYHDVMTCGKNWEPNTEFEIILHRNSDKLCIMQHKDDTNTYKIILDDIHLSYDIIAVTKQVETYHNTKIRTQTPHARIKKNFMKYYIVPGNTPEFSRSNFFYTTKNTLPEQIIILVMEQDRWLGKKGLNPYNYKPVEFTEIGLFINGKQTPYPFLSNIDEAGKIKLYDHFLENTGYGNAAQSGVEIPISYERYNDNCFMIAFDRTAAKHNGFYDTLPDSGFIDIHLKLETAKNENYVVCVYASYSEEMQIDGQRITTQPIQTRK